MKYAKYLKCLYFIGKFSKCLYYTKKAMCVCAIMIFGVVGISLISKGCCGCKALKELM